LGNENASLFVGILDVGVTEPSGFMSRQPMASNDGDYGMGRADLNSTMKTGIPNEAKFTRSSEELQLI
jgi:hypothetical protein